MSYDDNEILKWMKEIIDSKENEESFYNEIQMWRNRFLNSLPNYGSKEKAANIWATFLYMPSKQFMDGKWEHDINIPSKRIKEIEKIYEN